jgi:glycerol uptake facilitator-like aquaporin
LLHPKITVNRILAAEAIVTALLVATVVGSGIMAERLSVGNDAVALLGNTAATAAMLFVLITLLGPISGAQFNPVVTILLRQDKLRWPVVAVQVTAAIAGTALAHGMFDHPLIETGVKLRNSPAQWLGEAVATFGLLMTIRLGVRYRPESLPALVAAWITAGYWFTSSTSFANPAVTLARALTDSFAGIRIIDVPGFVVAQLIGAALGYWISSWLITEERT